MLNSQLKHTPCNCCDCQNTKGKPVMTAKELIQKAYQPTTELGQLIKKTMLEIANELPKEE